jgi:hypothetical protein
MSGSEPNDQAIDLTSADRPEAAPGPPETALDPTLADEGPNPGVVPLIPGLA